MEEKLLKKSMQAEDPVMMKAAAFQYKDKEVSLKDVDNELEKSSLHDFDRKDYFKELSSFPAQLRALSPHDLLDKKMELRERLFLNINDEKKFLKKK